MLVRVGFDRTVSAMSGCVFQHSTLRAYLPQAGKPHLKICEDELKAAVQIAADVMRMSTMFYGNEFDLETFKAMLKN